MRAIDADALTEELNNSHFPGAPYVDAGISIAIGKVLDAPTIEPERKTGKWIVHYECPKCGEITKDFTECCPFCGAEMNPLPESYKPKEKNDACD